MNYPLIIALTTVLIEVLLFSIWFYRKKQHKFSVIAALEGGLISEDQLKQFCSSNNIKGTIDPSVMFDTEKRSYSYLHELTNH